jgi:hypothetical protein
MFAPPPLNGGGAITSFFASKLCIIIYTYIQNNPIALYDINVTI